MMHWSIAVKMARKCDDISFDEWMKLYIPKIPTNNYINQASDTAYTILLRHKLIESGVVIDRKTR